MRKKQQSRTEILKEAVSSEIKRLQRRRFKIQDTICLKKQELWAVQQDIAALGGDPYTYDRDEV